MYVHGERCAHRLCKLSCLRLIDGGEQHSREVPLALSCRRCPRTSPPTEVGVQMRVRARMRMRMCIRMCMSMCVDVYTSGCVCADVSPYGNLCVRVCIPMCLLLLLFVVIHACICMCIDMHVYTQCTPCRPQGLSFKTPKVRNRTHGEQSCADSLISLCISFYLRPMIKVGV